MNEINVADLLVQYLEAEGVKAVFGVPGAPLNQLYRSFARSKIQVVLAKHEGGAAFMADGYSRFAGHLGVCMGTAGPGTTNLVTGLASAFYDGVPILAITGQVPTAAWGKGCLQESTEETVNTVSLLSHVCKYSDLVFEPSRIGAMIRRAIRVAESPKRGPVALNIPSNCLVAPVRPEAPIPYSFRAGNRAFDRLLVGRAAAALAEAEFPVILAGSGIADSGASQELRKLAEAFAMPVATSQRGKGVFPEHHPLSMGVYGFAGHPLANEAIDHRADLVLAVGTSLGQLQTGNFQPGLGRARLIQVDADPAQIGRNYPVLQGLVGDAQIVLKELYYHVARLLRGQVNTRLSSRQRIKEDLFAQVPRIRFPETLESDATPIWPQRVVAEIQRALPEDAVVFWDSGSHAVWGIHYFRASRPENFVNSSSFAAMGYSVAAAIGAQVARPSAPVVCVTGDGCFQMHGLEVATAVNHRIPVIWIVFNNGGMRMVEQGQKSLYGEAYSWQFEPVDFARLGSAMGARGIKVERPEELAPALARAIQERVPTVIDVVVDPHQVPPAFTNANA